MKIWVKTMKDDKIIANTVVEREGKATKSLIEACLRAACEELDIPSPMLLASHITNLFTFSTLKLLPINFVETVPFEHMIVEDITL